jgi:RimJ/RimL family protein N-acetyltransferase
MIVVNDLSAAYQISAAVDFIFNPHSDVCIARIEDGELWGGVIYTDYTRASIGLHVAGFRPDWVNKAMLWVCFDYPFNQLKVKKLFGQVPAHNLKALEFDRKLGFKEEARVKDVYPEGDLVVLAMYRDDCRWLKMRRPDGA